MKPRTKGTNGTHESYESHQSHDENDFIQASGSNDLVAAGGEMQITATGDRGRLKRFEVVAYHGGYLDLPNFEYPVVVDLQGMEVPAPGNLPMLRDHKGDKVVGHADRIEKSATQLIVAGVISGTGPDAKEVRLNAKRGFKWQSSIGAGKRAELVLIAAGQQHNVNGRTLAGPFLLAPRTKLGEVSFVAVGADRTPAAALIATGQTQGSDPMNFSAWLKAKGIDESKLDAPTKKVLEATYQAEIQASAGQSNLNAGGATGTVTAPAATTTADPAAGGTQIQAAGTDGAALMGEQFLAQRRRLMADEARREDQIRSIVSRYNCSHITINAAGEHDITATTRVSLLAHAIERGWSANDVELAAMRSERPQVGQSAQRSGGAALNANVILAACALTAGIPADTQTPGGEQVAIVASGLPDAERQRVLNEAMSGRYQGYGINDAMQAVCIQAGSPFDGSFKTNSFLEHYRNCDRMLKASGISTVSLSGILSNTAQKALLAAYQAMDVVWKQIAAVRTLQNFKPTTMYCMGMDGGFREVGPDGNLEHATLSESSYSLRAKTFGRKLKFTRQMRIDDDLGALSEWGTFLGQEGPRAIERAIFRLILANTGSFWHANNKNLITDVLASAGLSAARTNFRKHVDANGQPILVPADRLLVATALEDTVDTLINARSLPVGGDTVTDRKHWGKFPGGAHSSPYIDNTDIKDEFGAAYSGQSATMWFLFSNPAVLAALYAGFLNGQQMATIESSTGEFSNDGLEIEAFLDFGVAFGDPAASTKSTGAGS